MSHHPTTFAAEASGDAPGTIHWDDSATLHRQFQDFGDCEYEHTSGTDGRINIRNAVCYSPAYCSSEAGYLEQVIAAHGGTAARVTESACQCAGDDRCTFELRWQ